MRQLYGNVLKSRENENKSTPARLAYRYVDSPGLLALYLPSNDIFAYGGFSFVSSGSLPRCLLPRSLSPKRRLTKIETGKVNVKVTTRLPRTLIHVNLVLSDTARSRLHIYCIGVVRSSREVTFSVAASLLDVEQPRVRRLASEMQCDVNSMGWRALAPARPARVYRCPASPETLRTRRGRDRRWTLINSRPCTFYTGETTIIHRDGDYFVHSYFLNLFFFNDDLWQDVFLCFMYFLREKDMCLWSFAFFCRRLYSRL